MGAEKEKMNRATKYGFGTGHIMNDMCASLWFTYLLLYYEKVINLGAVYAGIILLVGQIADGIATIVVGILSDRETNLRVCLKYGKRKVCNAEFKIFRPNESFKNSLCKVSFTLLHSFL